MEKELSWSFFFFSMCGNFFKSSEVHHEPVRVTCTSITLTMSTGRWDVLMGLVRPGSGLEPHCHLLAWKWGPPGLQVPMRGFVGNETMDASGEQRTVTYYFTLVLKITFNIFIVACRVPRKQPLPASLTAHQPVFRFSNKPSSSYLRAFVCALPCPWNAFPDGFSPSLLFFYLSNCSLNSKSSKRPVWTILTLN